MGDRMWFATIQLDRGPNIEIFAIFPSKDALFEYIDFYTTKLLNGGASPKPVFYDKGFTKGLEYWEWKSGTRHARFNIWECDYEAMAGEPAKLYYGDNLAQHERKRP